MSPFLGEVIGTMLLILLGDGVVAATPLYPTYAAAPRVMGLEPIADQQLAGLVMWMPGGMIYLLALSLAFFDWLRYEDQPARGHPIP